MIYSPEVKVRNGYLLLNCLTLFTAAVRALHVTDAGACVGGPGFRRKSPYVVPCVVRLPVPRGPAVLVPGAGPVAMAGGGRAAGGPGGEGTAVCLPAGQELCWGLLRGCTLDCPFGLLTDAHGCETCRCRPRPRKCRPAACDKSCPFGYLYVLRGRAPLRAAWTASGR